MFDNLEDTLKLIVEKLETQEELLQLSISVLNTKKSVANFLGKSEKTIDNYIANNTLKKDIHYFYNGAGKLEFIPMGIVKFKRNPAEQKALIKEDTKDDTKKVYHPSVKTIVEGLKVG
jgi:hypothetical protein